ncbi:hypothetical protein [uncultured Croceitalea sp.]|uniref:hypothetical protein n=1 Tax=uncultured Croceitalea sp. TaxID=1798908 RepID=UPI0033058E66
MLRISNGLVAAVNPSTTFFQKNETDYQCFRRPIGWTTGLLPSAGWFSRSTVPDDELTLFENVGLQLDLALAIIVVRAICSSMKQGMKSCDGFHLKR